MYKCIIALLALLPCLALAADNQIDIKGFDGVELHGSTDSVKAAKWDDVGPDNLGLDMFTQDDSLNYDGNDYSVTKAAYANEHGVLMVQIVWNSLPTETSFDISKVRHLVIGIRSKLIEKYGKPNEYSEMYDITPNSGSTSYKDADGDTLLLDWDKFEVNLLYFTQEYTDLANADAEESTKEDSNKL